MNPRVHNYTALLRSACGQFVLAACQNHSTLVQIWFPPKPKASFVFNRAKKGNRLEIIYKNKIYLLN